MNRLLKLSLPPPAAECAHTLLFARGLGSEDQQVEDWGRGKALSSVRPPFMCA